MNNKWTSIGLTNKDVLMMRKLYGSNEIEKPHSKSFLKMLLESLGDPIIKILLIALAIKVVFLFRDFDWFETIGIVVAIILASFISTISEYGSEQAFKRLQEESSKIKVRVKRNKQIMEVSVDEVVKNEIVLLNAGDKIPADGILISGELNVDESILSGETKEKIKTLNTDTKLFRGTTVYAKEGIMQVTEVGKNTFYGSIASNLKNPEIDSPLKIKLRNLAKIISKIGYIGSILVVISYLFSVIVISNNFNINAILDTVTNSKLMIGHLLYSLTLCVTIIVVSVPEGLPMMITLVLSSNMKKMLKSNVLVRKMVGIETSGSLNVLFTDKTGTLTKGKLEAVGIVTYNNELYKSMESMKKYSKLENLVEKSILYNNESIFVDNHTIGGNVTDQALLNFIKKSNDCIIEKKVPFDSKNKYSISIYKNNLYIKGAFEVLLSRCSYYYDNFGRKKVVDKLYISNVVNSYAKKGYRILLLAIKENTEFLDDINDLIFAGIVLIKDEIRESSIEGVQTIKESGIQVIMITGDAKDTALSIAQELDIASKEDIILNSNELSILSDQELKDIFPKIKVISRALPSDKLRLVNIAQSMNLVVGMTGDGVNDAPALKKADVGFAMGSGTEVAKEAADIVILDDNISSIGNAILYGRTTYKSIRKFIVYQLTCNVCALIISIVSPLIGINTPITIIQMLWINMIMDTFAALAFSFEPALKEYMKELPKNKNENIMNSYMYSQVLISGSYSALLCILFLVLPSLNGFIRIDLNNRYLMTAYFALFIFIGICNAFNSRTTRINIINRLKENKLFIFVFTFILAAQIVLIYYGSDLFRTYGLNIKELLFVGILSLSVIPIDMLRKYILKRHYKITTI